MRLYKNYEKKFNFFSNKISLTCKVQLLFHKFYLSRNVNFNAIYYYCFFIIQLLR